ncbi:FHA domain-containing protein [Iamia sp. SCSIO 61187]|uniref:FHA domain-containing protein n=1 Tax=Iamia sp. SCSIO 61187 TaxID=2722752 RepID=UPI001C62E0AC|nr:FHA domain-containing protein [Iamia sp. SCSIO 61187]QYG94796.1 FHA domain-containing protein [Iamia sp. SCSIO 61187]
MTLHLRVDPAPWTATFAREEVARVGRSRSADVRVGHQRIGDRWTVSSEHAELRWDGTRWATRNVSSRTGLLHVYEPGYEEVPLEPGRPWVPVRHRWALAFGPPDHRTVVVATTDDHAGPGTGADAPPASEDPDPTMSLDDIVAVALTALERDVLLAYYSDFALLPRPAVLAPRTHDEAARRLGRSRDSTRKAIERVNDKIARAPGAPAAATGRNVTPEIGSWLARMGLVDPL